MIPSTSQFGFRNKMQFSFAMDAGQLQIGLYAARSHRVVDTDECPIMTPEMNAVLPVIRQWHHDYPETVFDEATGQGVLRHLTIRHAMATNQLMVIVTLLIH